MEIDEVYIKERKKGEKTPAKKTMKSSNKILLPECDCFAADVKANFHEKKYLAKRNGC